MSIDLESRIEARLRKKPFWVPLVTLVVAFALYLGLGACISLYRAGHLGIVLLSGLLVHALMIVLVHDGAHRAITRNATIDSTIMNFGAGLVLLPFYGEPFRRYHLIHHKLTNRPTDPLWPGFKQRLYEERRIFYMVLELIPLAFTVMALAVQAKAEQAPRRPEVRYAFVGLAVVVSVIVFAAARPPFGFCLRTVLTLNFWGTLRHWSEHLGESSEKESNCFVFPLGFGIGNHDSHHLHPHFSWITMSLGLLKKKKDTDPLRTVFGMLFKPAFRHYPPSVHPQGLGKTSKLGE